MDLVTAWNCLRIKNPNAIAQIKYPGLEWFSILDPLAAVSIGRIMAQSRTAPLNIARFYAKKGKPADPIAVLLYAKDIPFEIIVNTKHSDGCYVPTFISMTPEDNTIRIKKVSSTCNFISDLLNMFFLERISGQKVFIIEQMEAPFSKASSSAENNNQLFDVVIVLNEGNMHILFKRNGNTYYAAANKEGMNTPRLANDKQRAAYFSLLKRASAVDDSDTSSSYDQPEATTHFKATLEKKARSYNSAKRARRA
jgi:hypothetical protein